MTESEKRKTGGGKLTRSETVTVRLEPKLRYLAEVAGRKQRRTLSSFVEWAVQKGLEQTILEEDGGSGTSVEDVASALWDVDEEDRFVKLALRFPDLLTHEEQVLWKLIRECGLVWRGRFMKDGDEEVWAWQVREESLIFPRLREHWPTFVAVARGTKDRSELPKWISSKPKGNKGGFEEMDDDIPF